MKESLLSRKEFPLLRGLGSKGIDVVMRHVTKGVDLTKGKPPVFLLNFKIYT
jgi:hypothetical protein